VRTVARGLVSTALLILSVVLVLAAGAPVEGLRLASVGGLAVALRALLLIPPVTRAFGAFAVPLDLGVSLALVLAALSLTGGVMSDLYPLILLEIVLARVFDGPAAARFFTLVALFGLLALLSPGAAPGLVPAFPAGLRVFWPVALLAALEVAGGVGLGPVAVRPEAVRQAAAARPVAASPASPAVRPAFAAAGARVPEPPHRPAPVRNPTQELLHDLKSPLSAIRVYSDLIAEDAQRGEPPRPEHLQNLEKELTLLERMAGVSRREPAPAPAPRPAPLPRTELVTLLSSLAESYHAVHGQKLRIEYLSEEPQISVAADPVAVQRAFRNILDNAVKYTPPGGQLRLRSSVVSQHAFVVISDTGIGMTAEEQRRAFEYAYRGPAARASGAEGRGLGLAVTRELLEQNGAKISLLSEPGHGLEVTIMFPLLKGGRT
jgi:signal transduction histidine kinase